MSLNLAFQGFRCSVERVASTNVRRSVFVACQSIWLLRLWPRGQLLRTSQNHRSSTAFWPKRGPSLASTAQRCSWLGYTRRGLDVGQTASKYIKKGSFPNVQTFQNHPISQFDQFLAPIWCLVCRPSSWVRKLKNQLCQYIQIVGEAQIQNSGRNPSWLNHVKPVKLNEPLMCYRMCQKGCF